LILTASGLQASSLTVPVTLTRIPNSVVDGGFEQAAGSPWEPTSFAGVAILSLDRTIRRSGASAARIEAATDDDARFVQTITVQPNTRYRLAGWIRTENVKLGHGANLTIERSGSNESSPRRNGTTDWTYVWLDVDSGSDTSFQVEARLGNYSATSQGRAWFDDLSLTQIIP
jgi:hypothetical protein